MNTIAIIQARMGSTRLPGKVLKKIGEYTILDLIYKRLKQSKEIDKIIIATSINKSDDKIINFCQLNNIEYYREAKTTFWTDFIKPL